MSHSEEMWHYPIGKSIKYRRQCTRSNIINGNFRQITKEKICVDLIGPYNT